jgi:hypothetical protein
MTSDSDSDELSVLDIPSLGEADEKKDVESVDVPGDVNHGLGNRDSAVDHLEDARSEPKFEKGDAVEGFYEDGDQGEWFEGTISKVRNDGTYDILYDDGDKEKRKQASHIRARRDRRKLSIDDEEKRSDAKDIRGEDGQALGAEENKQHIAQSSIPRAFEEGDEIEANYNGKGTWFKGRVSRVRGDNTCDIEYEDGDIEKRVQASNIRPRQNGEGENMAALVAAEAAVEGLSESGSGGENIRRGEEERARKMARVQDDSGASDSFDFGSSDLEGSDGSSLGLSILASEAESIGASSGGSKDRHVESAASRLQAQMRAAAAKHGATSGTDTMSDSADSFGSASGVTANHLLAKLAEHSEKAAQKDGRRSPGAE